MITYTAKFTVNLPNFKTFEEVGSRIEKMAKYADLLERTMCTQESINGYRLPILILKKISKEYPILSLGGDHPYILLQCIQDACYLSYTDNSRLDMPKHNTLPNANKEHCNESGELKRNMKILNLKAKEHLRLMSQLDYQHQVVLQKMALCSRVAQYPIFNMPEDPKVQKQLENRNKEFDTYHNILKKEQAIRTELLQECNALESMMFTKITKVIQHIKESLKSVCKMSQENPSRSNYVYKSVETVDEGVLAHQIIKFCSKTYHFTQTQDSCSFSDLQEREEEFYVLGNEEVPLKLQRNISIKDERRCKTIPCKNIVGKSGIAQEISKKHRQTHKLSLMNGEITFGWIKSGIFSSKAWTLFGH